MAKIVGVQFKEKGKMYYFDLNNIDICESKYVIVNTEKGLERAKVISEDKNLEDKAKDLDISKVIRLSTEDDERKYIKNVKDAEKAIIVATDIAKKLGLSMTFVDANYNFERTQLMFYFLSDGRVDFRDLAKQLAGVFKTRIELRQIGVRDKAKEVSGIGPCGIKLCCSSFLSDLDSVTISMAKNQNIVLNPTKINGLCGRLLCCLNYEDELYTENRKDMPELGKTIDTKYGKGNVIFVDIPNKKVIVNIPDHGKETIYIEDGCEKCEKSCK